MILNSIILHNFMSYGDTTLDLTSISIACLSGPNGAGKSAIMDAVTWAMWESARSSSDELIRLGEQEMWVDVTFELEGQRYRVRRSRQRTASVRTGQKTSSKGNLEFQVWNSSESKWQSLTAPSIRETQEKICETLRMDYDTFINSVYLRQGRADEFTTRPPSERKQVLAEILGLSYFDRLQELARDEAKSRRIQVEALQHSLNGSANLAQHIAESTEVLRSLATNLQTRCETIDDSKVKLAHLSEQIDELNSLQSRLQPTNSRLVELSEDLIPLQASLEKLRKRNEELIKTLESAGELEAANAAFKHARDKVEHLDQTSLRRQEVESRSFEIKSLLATMRGRMEVELEHLKEQRQALSKTAEKLEKDLAGKDKLEADYASYKKQLLAEAELARKQEAHAQLSNRAEQLHTMIVEARLHLEAELDHKKQAHIELGSLIEGRTTLDSEEAELNRQADELDRLEVEFEGVEEQGLKLKQQIDTTHLLEEEQHRRLAENETKAKELLQTASLTMCPLCAAPIVDRMAVMARYDKTEEEIRSRITELKSEASLLEAKRDALRQRYVGLRRNLDGRKALDKKIGEFNARKSALERADASFSKLTSEIADLERRLTNQDYAHVERESLIAIKAEIHKLDFDSVIYTSLQSQIRAQRHIEVRHQQFKRDAAELERLQQEMPLLDQKISEISRKLDTDDFGGELRSELKELSDKLAEFRYDRVEHQSLRQELARLLPLVDRFKELDRARDELPLVQEELRLLEQSWQQKTKVQETLQKSVFDWTRKLESLPTLTETKSQLETSIEASEKERQELSRQVAVLESKLEHLELESSAFALKKAQIDELIASMNDYEYLAETFGKKGIQAIIIENAVPEIEAEANSILSRLSDNQMHVALVTQYRTKQGSLQETLDIVIADDLGTRNYELYSGGEAFKINFAIRVALSRLLARRAGAKLQSLIIDEGFGSQDEDSRMRLINAIHAIKPDFARILVVTHIAEIKELFPVQIQVNKVNGTSQVSVVHSF